MFKSCTCKEYNKNKNHGYFLILQSNHLHQLRIIFVPPFLNNGQTCIVSATLLPYNRNECKSMNDGQSCEMAFNVSILSHISITVSSISYCNQCQLLKQVSVLKQVLVIEVSVSYCSQYQLL